jgi:phenylpropionate dioxygenase-like ring-hydroxylating dioxygenase large terminal subunit
MTASTQALCPELHTPQRFFWIGRPLGEARSAPGDFYTSREVFDAEVRHIHLKHWIFIGRADQVAEPGSYMAVETVGGPVLVTRDEHGALHCFANFCRHRGTQLAEGCGKRRNLVCPYHAWAFGLDGRLLRAPGMADTPGFDPAKESLIPIRMESWAGNLFINFDDGAQDLASYLGSFTTLFATHRVEDMRCVFHVDIPANCNWKMLLENALESYHTGIVHARTVGAQTSVTVPGEENWTAIQVLSEMTTAVLDKSAPAPFPQIEGLHEQAKKGTYFTLIEPSTQLVFAQDCMWWLAVRPIAPDRSVLSVGGCFPKEHLDHPDFAELAKPYFARWEAVAKEDVGILEKQQLGLRSVRFVPGALSSRDDVVHTFGEWVRKRLGAVYGAPF